MLYTISVGEIGQSSHWECFGHSYVHTELEDKELRRQRLMMYFGKYSVMTFTPQTVC